MAVKMNLRRITKRYAADPEIGFLTKSISKPIGCTIAMPTAWELGLFPDYFKILFPMNFIENFSFMLISDIF